MSNLLTREEIAEYRESYDGGWTNRDRMGQLLAHAEQSMDVIEADEKLRKVIREQILIISEYFGKCGERSYPLATIMQNLKVALADKPEEKS